MFNEISHRSVYVPPTTDENPLFLRTHERVYFIWKCHVLNNLTHEGNIALSTSSCIARRAEGTWDVPSKQTPFLQQCIYLLMSVEYSTTWLSFGYSVDKRTEYTRSRWNSTRNNASWWCQQWRWSRSKDGKGLRLRVTESLGQLRLQLCLPNTNTNTNTRSYLCTVHLKAL
jgi:hypothetical protein